MSPLCTHRVPHSAEATPSCTVYVHVGDAIMQVKHELAHPASDTQTDEPNAAAITDAVAPIP
jgi:hypothetical protein